MDLNHQRDGPAAAAVYSIYTWLHLSEYIAANKFTCTESTVFLEEWLSE